MGKKKKEEGGEPKPPSKLKSAMVPVVIFLLGIIVGQKVLGGGATVVQAAETDAAHAEVTVETTLPPPEVIPLGKTTVSLSDGHMLQFGLTVQLVAEPVEPESTEEAAAEGEAAATEGEGEAAAEPAAAESTEPGPEWAKAFGIAGGVFGSRTAEELWSAEGRNEAMQEVQEQLRAAYPERVDLVFVDPFVIPPNG